MKRWIRIIEEPYPPKIRLKHILNLIRSISSSYSDVLMLEQNPVQIVILKNKVTIRLNRFNKSSSLIMVHDDDGMKEDPFSRELTENKRDYQFLIGLISKINKLDAQDKIIFCYEYYLDLQFHSYEDIVEEYMWSKRYFYELKKSVDAFLIDQFGLNICNHDGMIDVKSGRFAKKGRIHEFRKI